MAKTGVIFIIIIIIVIIIGVVTMLWYNGVFSSKKTPDTNNNTGSNTGSGSGSNTGSGSGSGSNTGSGNVTTPNPINEAGKWQCVPNITKVPLRRNANGDIECVSYYGRGCKAMECNESIIASIPADTAVFVCGDGHSRFYPQGGSGYCDTKNMCSQALDYFNTKYGIKKQPFVRFRNKNDSTRCLSGATAATFGMVPCSNSKDQLWELEGPGFKKIRNAANCNWCIAASADKNTLTYEQCQLTDRFEWAEQDADPKVMRLENVSTISSAGPGKGKCLRVTGVNGVPQLYTCDYAPNEYWILEPAHTI